MHLNMDKKYKYYRESGKIILRPLRVWDAIDVYKNIRRKEVSKWTSEPLSSKYNNKIFQFTHKILRYAGKVMAMGFKAVFRVKEKRVFRFAIELKNEHHQVIGIVSITRIDKGETVADVGFWIGPDYWGQGYVSKAVSLAIDMAFNELNFTKLKAWTYGKNIGSQKVLVNNQFRLIDIEKDKYDLYDEMHDRHNYELAKDSMS